MKSQLFLIALISITLASCFEKVDKSLIIGRWTGVEWLSDGAPSDYVPSKAAFTFNNNGNYSFEYGGTIENGKYFISNDQLFTTPEGGIKMMVKIVQLTNDTLVFDMNRAGISEKLTLVKN